MKKLLITLTLFLASNLVGFAQQAGDLDASFGTNGLVENSVSQFAFFEPVNSFLSSDGKIILAGGYAFNFALAQLNADGSLDATFGNSGLAFTAFDGYINCMPSRAVRATDGSLYIIGYAQVNATGLYESIVARYTASGNLDPTFGNQGIFRMGGMGSGSTSSLGYSMALEPNGKIIVGCVSYSDLQPEIAYTNLFRLNTDGSIDSVSYDYSNNAIVTGYTPTDVIVQADGKIIYTDGTTCFRRLPNGDIDPSFGTAGMSVVGGNEFFYTRLIQPNNSDIYVYGQIRGDSAVTNMFVVKHLNNSGTIDPAFGTNGMASMTFTQNCYLSEMLAQPDGKLIAIGDLRFGLFSSDPHQFLLARFNSDGSVDNTFGSSGMVSTDFPEGNAIAKTGILQPDGKLLVIGFSFSSGDGNIALARYYAYDANGVSSNYGNEIANVYPNPAADLLILQTDLQWTGTQYELFDSSGKLVGQGIISSEKTMISLMGFSQGIYYLRFQNNKSAIISISN